MSQLRNILIVIILIIGGSVYVGAYSLDGDGLHYSEEIEHNTNPFNYDTDNDGLSDRFEVNNGYNPRKKTILLNIQSDEYIDDEAKYKISKIKEEFAEAPVKNPNGTTGINLYIHYKQIDDIDSKITYDKYEKNIVGQIFHKQGKGYYNILLVDEVCINENNCEKIGVAKKSTSYSIVEKNSPHKMARTVMHELGHMIGMTNIDYEGIDTTKKSSEEYTSVMNYNKPDTLQYSEGEINDWEFIDLAYKTNTVKNDTIVVSVYKKGIFYYSLGLNIIYNDLIGYTSDSFKNAVQDPNTQLFNIIQMLLLLVLIGMIIKKY
jgi:hypothetical protein